MLPPKVYEEARRTAAEHVLVAIERVGPLSGRWFGTCKIEARVVRCWRGRLGPGDAVTFEVACIRPEAPRRDVPIGSTLWLPLEKVQAACVLEAFLDRDGARLDVASGQVSIVTATG